MLNYNRVKRLIIIVLSVAVSISCSSKNQSDPVNSELGEISITANRSSCEFPYEYQFNASLPASVNNNLLRYEWNFGDGGVTTGVSSSHQYNATGIYGVTFTVRDNLKIISTANLNHSVNGCSISGTILAKRGSEADSDVNDFSAPFKSNNEIETAQLIRNPVIVGGFVSEVGTGVPGDRFESEGDSRDVYQVELLKNQTITLGISEFSELNPAAIDLDLFLVAPADLANPVASSVDTVATESLVVPESGNYFIVVSASSGASNYQLGVGTLSANSSLPSIGLRLENEIFTDQIVVRFKDSVGISAVVDSLQARALSVGLTAVAGNARAPMLFRLQEGAQREQTFSSFGIQASSKYLPSSVLLSASSRAKYDTLKVIKKLRARPDVSSADPNYVRKPLLVPNDTHYAKQWHYPLINLPQAWDRTTGTPAAGNVIVAIVDTGVVLNHPDIENKLVPGYDFIRDDQNSGDNEPGIDNNPDDPGDGENPGDSSFHGTHVSGTVAAETNNNSGVSGVSWGARIMPIRVLGKLGGSSFDVIQGIRYAAGLSNTSNTVPVVRADIINLSLGGGGFSQAEQNTFTEARNAGVIVVAAAGNEASDIPSYPASYDGVISVSAVDSQKQLAPYSNLGNKIDIAAPGGDTSKDVDADGFEDGVLSAAADDADGAPEPIFRFYQGTSMASPHIAGVLALMKAVYPGLTPNVVDDVIGAGLITEDLRNDGVAVRNDSFGYGLIDALKAVNVANDLANGGERPAVLSTTPNFLNFENFLTEITITASNIGAQTLFITNISVDAPWLQAAPVSVDANNLGDYKVSVNRTGLGVGLYSANVTFVSDVVGSITVPVSMIVGTVGEGVDQLGQLRVSLLKADNDQVVKTILINRNSDNEYQYIFNELQSGNYVVIASTDSDNDGLVCDAGEACGAYSTFERKTEINLSTSSILELNFPVGFDLIIRR